MFREKDREKGDRAYRPQHALDVRSNLELAVEGLEVGNVDRVRVIFARKKIATQIAGGHEQRQDQEPSCTSLHDQSLS